MANKYAGTKTEKNLREASAAKKESFEQVSATLEQLAKDFEKEDSPELAAWLRGVAAKPEAHKEFCRVLLNNEETAQVFGKSDVRKKWVCRNCGLTVIGTKLPERCPFCDHPQSYFELREENF